ncbi:MAG: tRNA 2-selenouridine(34) synthase MnmH [Pseudomonadota bacterium]
MAVEFQNLTDVVGHGFDDIIDVRSPAEFAEDRIPGALSLPVLSDEERARVGTIYVQDCPFNARKIGAALVARNAARHIETVLADRDGGWRPLIYCWRGGQRSGSFASILAQIGWRAETVQGGYQQFRRLVVKALYEGPVSPRLVVLDGYTGSAKTDVLSCLAGMGVAVIDLEGLARHRGSVLGAMPGGQPSQKAFETGIAMALAGVPEGAPVVVEAESSKVGDRIVPPAVWKAMRAAPRIVIEAPVAARAEYLARAYSDVTADGDAFGARLEKLIPYHGHEAVGRWRAMLGEGAHAALAAELIETHYDARYAKSRARAERKVLETIEAPVLDKAAVQRIAADVAAVVRRL